MQRTLQPEILDSLAPTDPKAAHNRRDLRLINRCMGNPRWFARTLPRLLRPGERILELGAGLGDLAQRLRQENLALDALDLWPRPAGWPPAQAWHRADARTFAGYGDYAVVIGNLIFHQFADHELTALGEKLRHRARVIVACEPMRRRQSQALFRLVAPAFGAHPITLHDAHVSIAAGFCGDELPRLLGLDETHWDCRVTTTLLGAYRLVAIRRAR